jgi:hypothetical protein
MKTLLIILFSIILFSCTKEQEDLSPSISVTYDTSNPYGFDYGNFRRFFVKVENVNGADSILYVWVVNSTDTTWTNMNHIEFIPYKTTTKYIVECTAIIYDKNPYLYKLTLSNYTILYIQ